MNTGEEIHRDMNVCVRCIPTGRDLSECAWGFFNGSICDILYIPTDQLPISSIAQSSGFAELSHCRNVVIGRRGTSAGRDVDADVNVNVNVNMRNDLVGLEGIKAFLRM